MDRNTLIALILSGIVIVGFSALNSRLYPPKDVPKTETRKAEIEARNAQNEEAARLISSADSADEGDIQQENFVVKTDFAEITLTNRGGDIVSYKMTDHLDSGEPVQMADNIAQQSRAFSIAFGGDGNRRDEIFSVKREDDMTLIFSRKFSCEGKGFTLAKRYSFKKDDYMFKLDVAMSADDGDLPDMGGFAYTLFSVPQIGPKYDRKADRSEYREFVAFSDGKKKSRRMGDGQTFEYKNLCKWAGVAGKYFTALVVAPENCVSKAVFSTAIRAEGSADAQVSLFRDAQKGQILDSYLVYLGPRTEKKLAAYNMKDKNPWGADSLSLNSSLSTSGIWYFLETILKWLMEFFYKLVPNWGVSIIFTTIVIKLALFPLTMKSTISSLNMQKLQPQMQALQAKYAGSPEKLNQEMMRLYGETGCNPMSGCLPLLIQMPLLFAMYNLFNTYFEFRGAMFIPGWIPDLSKGDVVLSWKPNLPFFGQSLRLLPIIYLFSQILFTKVTQSSATAPNNPSMKFMMYGMPIMFFVMFYNFAAGLLLYWTVANVLQLVQQTLLQSYIKRHPEIAQLKKKSGAKGKKKKF